LIYWVCGNLVSLLKKSSMSGDRLHDMQLADKY
jgi:hypothetical protein